MNRYKNFSKKKEIAQYKRPKMTKKERIKF